MDVIFEVMPGAGGDIGKIILNRPQNLNALNLSMCVSIHHYLTAWAQQPSIKAVIITGAGERAFCAGGDVRAIYEWCTKKDGKAESMNFFQQEYAMNQAIFDFPKPYIAFLDGITMGGGVGVSIHGSHSVATERLIWAMPETAIGLFPDVGVGYYLVKLPDHIGRYLAFTGEKLKAEDAYKFGLVQACVPSARLKDLEQKLIATPFESSDFNTVTQLIARFHQHPVENPQLLPMNIQAINQYFSAPAVEDIYNNLQRSEDTWCQTSAKILAYQSPLSLKITDHHLRHCAYYNFTEVMAENSRLIKHFLQGSDFMEGIRAAVIDKDRRPRWRPATLSAVKPEMVQAYFL